MIELKLRDRIISTQLPAFIMGIVNCTPDSFYEKSRGGAEQALRMIEEGADIIDLGGESTRPGAEYIDENEEIKRIIPVLKEIRKRSSAAVSVDTRKYSVMKAAFEEGADIVNDISALEDDEKLGPFVKETGMSVILMHKRGNSVIMQQNTEYQDAFAEVNEYLEKRALFAENLGIEREKIIVDPGIGFGKDVKANTILVNRCGELCGGKYKVLMALSRKSFLGILTGKSVEERLSATVAANLIAVKKGASILRVHDVSQTKDMLSVLRGIEFGIV